MGRNGGETQLKDIREVYITGFDRVLGDLG